MSGGHLFFCCFVFSRKSCYICSRKQKTKPFITSRCKGESQEKSMDKIEQTMVEIHDLCDKIKERIESLGMHDYVLFAGDYWDEYDEFEGLLEDKDTAASLDFYVKEEDDDRYIRTFVRKIKIKGDKLVFCLEDLEESDWETETVGTSEETIDSITDDGHGDNTQTAIRCLESILECAFDTEFILDLNKRRYGSERNAMAEAARKAQEDVERKAEAERKVEAARKKAEAERKAREAEVERKAQEEVERKAAAERKAEAARKKAAAERKAREAEAERKANIAMYIFVVVLGIALAFLPLLIGHLFSWNKLSVLISAMIIWWSAWFAFKKDEYGSWDERGWAVLFLSAGITSLILCGILVVF